MDNDPEDKLQAYIQVTMLIEFIEREGMKVKITDKGWELFFPTDPSRDGERRFHKNLKGKTFDELNYAASAAAKAKGAVWPEDQTKAGRL